MKILIGIDSSPASHYVVEEAAARPWPARAMFALIHVVDPYQFAHVPKLLEDAKREGSALVNAAAHTLSRAGHKPATEILLGSPRIVISKQAKQRGANLVMVGSHGQGALARFLLGSVAQATLSTASCSVEIVRSSASGSPASSRSMKVLLATDGTEFSAAAAKSVASRPWPAGSQFRFLSVRELPTFQYPASAHSPAPAYPPGLIQELTDCAGIHARECVEAARKILKAAGLSTLETETPPVGNVRAVILDEAGSWGADLIVLGSHGRRGMERLILGSVSESVAIYAHCSVEVIRP